MSEIPCLGRLGRIQSDRPSPSRSRSNPSARPSGSFLGRKGLATSRPGAPPVGVMGRRGRAGGSRSRCPALRPELGGAAGGGGALSLRPIGARETRDGGASPGGRPPLAREPATVRSGRRGRSRSVRQEASCLWEFVSRVVGKTPDPLSVNELHEDLYTLRWAASNFATERVHVTGRRYSLKFNYLISNNFFVSVKDCQQLKTPLNHRGLLVVLGDLFTDFSTDFVESGGAAQAVKELVHESPNPHEMGARSED